MVYDVKTEWKTFTDNEESVKTLLRQARRDGMDVRNDSQAGTVEILYRGECVYRALRLGAKPVYLVRAAVFPIETV